MKLHDPFLITPRLSPGLKVGEFFLSLTDIRHWNEGRQTATFIWDGPGGKTYQDSTMRSAVGGFRNYVEIFHAYLTFAYACKTGRDDGENKDLFPAWLMGEIDSTDLDYLMFALSDEEGDPDIKLIELEDLS